MIKRSLITIIVTGLAFHANATPMSMEQILQQVVDHYPSLKIASMQVERAAKDSVRVNSQLGWQLSGQSGLSHESTMTGAAVDRLMVGGGAAKKLTSGDLLSLSGSLRYDDLDDSIIATTQPDPSKNFDFEINYRKPLARGADNIDYTLSLTQAEVATRMAQAQERAQYDQIAAQVLALYLQAVITRKQIDNVKSSIKHSQRLEKFVKSRLGLGIAERKDKLQVAAQLNGLEARLKGLQLIWVQQEITLNRLMGEPWDHTVEISLSSSNHTPNGALDESIEEALRYSPELSLIDSELTIADSVIRSKHNNRKDTLDLVGFVGNRYLSGDLSGSSTTLSEPQIGIRVEYKSSLDRSGYDAELAQAYLDRSIALQRRVDSKERTHYQIASLLAEIREGKTAHDAALLSKESEEAKLTEAEQRYRKGRIEIDRLIQFESQLTEAKLALALQQVELERRQYQLILLRGAIWQKIVRPQYDWTDRTTVPDVEPLQSKTK